MSDIIIKSSKIHGTELFAGRDFKKGETVLRWRPKVLTEGIEIFDCHCGSGHCKGNVK